jgi:hypothetical protein
MCWQSELYIREKTYSPEEHRKSDRKMFSLDKERYGNEAETTNGQAITGWGQIFVWKIF